MKKDDIINKIMEEFDISRIDAAEIVNNTFSILRNSLIKGKHINISEFGKFDVNYKKGENGKILKTISFSPVKKFSYDVNDSYNNLEPVTVAFITNFKEEDSAVDTDMEDYEEVIDEIDEKEFIKSRLTIVEEKTDEQTKFKEEIKEKFKETFKEDPATPKDEQKPEEKIEGKLHKLTEDRKKSFFDSERYKLNTPSEKDFSDTQEKVTEETISDKILSETIESPKETVHDFTFIDREELEEPLVVEFNQPEVTDDVKEKNTGETINTVDTSETIDTIEEPEVHGYIPTEKEILDFEKIREELNNKIRETFGEITAPEPVAEDEIDRIDKNDEVKEEEIREGIQPALTEDITEIESKDPEIRTPEESNILEEDLITQQEETEDVTDKTGEPKLEDLQSFRDMFEEKDKDKILDERDDLLKEIEDKISEDFAKLDEDDFKDIDSDTIKKIEDINKATEEKLKSQKPDDDIKIPDFDFKNLFKDTISGPKIPEEEIHEEFIEKFNEEVKDISKLEDKPEDLSFEGSDILIPEEIKQLHEEIQTVKPFEGIESKKEEPLQFKSDDDVKFDFFKDYNDIFEDKDSDADIVTHPSHGSQMPYPKNDLTDEQREGSKIFSLSILILIGIVIAVFAGIYFLLSSDLFKPKPAALMTDTVKTQSARPIVGNDSASDSVQQSQDAVKGKDSVTFSQQTQKPDTTKTQQTTPPANNNQTASNPEDAQYRKLNPGEEEQINDPVNNVVYIRTTDGVFIQTGSYKDKAVADEKANALKKAGAQNVSVVEANLGAKGVYYRVRVGKYPTVQEAKNNASKVKN